MSARFALSSRHFFRAVTAAVAILCAACGGSAPPVAVSPATLRAPAAPPAPPLTLLSAATARPNLVATFLVPSLERSLDSGVGLVRLATPLPLDAAGVRDLLLSQMGLSPDLAKHLDLKVPLSGAAVAAAQPGATPLMAFSVAAKSPADALALVAAAGNPISRRGLAVQVQGKTGDKGWFLPVGNVLLIADSEEALTNAGNLALEGRGAGKDDLSIVVYPDNLARAFGTTVKGALDLVLAQMAALSKASGGVGMTGESERQLRDFAEYFADAASAEIAVNLNATNGLGLLFRLAPRAGGKLERLTRETRTIALDPLLGAAATDKEMPAFILTSAYADRNLEQLRRQRALLTTQASKTGKAPGKELVAAGIFLDALTTSMVGDISAVFGLRGGFSGDIVYPLKTPASADVLSKALAGVDKATITAWLGAALGDAKIDFKVSSVKAETFGSVRGVRTVVSVSPPKDKSNAAVKSALAKMLGKKGFETLMAVVPGNRLAMTMGPGAKARMVAMSKGVAATRTKGLAQALETAGPRSVFFLADLREIIRFALLVGDDARMRGIGDSLPSPMPLVGGATGDANGKQFTVDLTVPPTCFAAMGGLVQAAMMMSR